MNKKEIVNRMKGCLYGQAIGNALGLISEFLSKKDVDNMFASNLRYYDQYPFQKGTWEDDDTMQMICLLDEFVETRGLTAQGAAKRLLNWLETDGRGCGNLVYEVLTSRDYTSDPVSKALERWEHSNCKAAPNGALMRTSVIGLWPKDVVEITEAACRVTHYDPRCVGSCVIATSIIYNLVWNDKALTYDEVQAIGRKYDSRIAEWVDLAYRNIDISALDLDEPSSIGYTLRTLAAVLWCYWHAKSFEDGLLAVVNEGGDADSNAAIACAVLGAKFGFDSITPYYVENLDNEKTYREIAERFISVALNEKKD